MQKLQQANLYHSELIPISGKLVERYNKCLETLGFKTTDLTSFSIDGIGWSPEIAEQRKNTNYLNHGDANPHGIIVTPKQKGKPVYVPFHTFDRDMMLHVFKTYGAEINDITRDCAICLDFDQEIDAFYDPMDILKYDEVTIGFRLINDLDQIQQQQMKLIDHFNADWNFIDEDIQQQLLDSAKTYGDLRGRVLRLNPIKFKTDSFYTRAFGGVYILRDFITPIMVFESDEAYKEAIKDTHHEVMIFHVGQPELLNKLRDHLIIECDLEKIVKEDRYERIKKHMLFEELKKTEHPVKDILSDKVLFRRYLNTIEIKSLKKVNGVEIYLERLERSNTYKINDLVDPGMYAALHKPHSSLEARHQDLVWRLLVNISPKDVLFLYWYDKERFYRTYQGWPDSFQDWVIDTIRNNI